MMATVNIKRKRKGRFLTVHWKFSKGGILTYIIVFAVICVNLIAIFIFGATTVTYGGENVSGLTVHDLSVNGQVSGTSGYINDILPNVKGRGLDTNISFQELFNIFGNFKDKDSESVQNYINAVLLHSNVTINTRSVSKDNFRTANEITRFINESHIFRILSTHPSISSTNKQNVTDLKRKHKESTLNTPEQNKNVISNSEMKSQSVKLKPSKLKNETGNTALLDRNLKESRNESVTSSSRMLMLCIENMKGLVGKITPRIQEKSAQEMASMFPMLQNGGHYTPKHCRPKENTAIIIPYRNRHSHLHILLLNILPLLVKQNIQFTVIVVDQTLPGAFNRGMLFNIGFLEAKKIDRFDCFIFHDVDLIPINDFIFYHCNDQPTHFLAGVDKFKYKLMYQNMFGGVVAFTHKQFMDINGASNLYFGWGGEDDDLQIRVRQKGYTVLRKYSEIGLYDMIKHKRDETNHPNPVRRQLLKMAKDRQNIEGLSTTVYTRHSVELLPLYTWIKVSISITNVLMTAPKYMDQVRDKLLDHFNVKQNTSQT